MKYSLCCYYKISVFVYFSNSECVKLWKSCFWSLTNLFIYFFQIQMSWCTARASCWSVTLCDGVWWSVTQVEMGILTAPGQLTTWGGRHVFFLYKTLRIFYLYLHTLLNYVSQPLIMMIPKVFEGLCNRSNHGSDLVQKLGYKTVTEALLVNSCLIFFHLKWWGRKR